MKKLFLLLLLVLPVIAYCGDKNTISGSWREVSRMKGGKEQVSFTDTILIKFMTGNEYVWQKAGGFIYKGTYKIESNGLDMGSRYFTIVERNANKMILKDDAATYEFKPYTEMAQNNMPKAPETYAPVTSIQQMTGHWSVYKGTNARKTESIDYTRQVKMIDIFPAQKDGAWGSVYSRRDADNAPSWMVKSYANQTIYCEGKDNRQFKVIKCEKNDLIIEEDGNTFFLRQFK